MTTAGSEIMIFREKSRVGKLDFRKI
ncbi:MAG: hypothetical protein JWM16_6414, partial [Verrucomicrobiales bacterium]|nr:hypothetical protein [Verrucomicrobiales bacterium]